MDGFSQLLNEELDELGPSTLEVLAKCLRRLVASSFAELGRDLVDRGFGKVSSELENGGVSILGRGSLIGFEPGPDAIDAFLAPDTVEIFVGPGRIQQVTGRQWLKFPRSEVVDDQPMENRSRVI